MTLKRRYSWVVLMLGLWLAITGCKAVSSSSSREASDSLSVDASEPVTDPNRAAQMAILEGSTKTSALTAPDMRVATNARLSDENHDAFIRSCVIRISSGVLCLQNTTKKTLFFCSGIADKDECKASQYVYTCTHEAKPDGVLVYFLNSSEAGNKICDKATLKSI